ncbi:MAG TPA: DUF4344 domain-containing metallopeptidase [Thermoanaerobaculia bacterium]|nr:DUF4344 domain-containing metallopeptidase [Thermoanaerobaculia bacterium]
MANAFRRFPVLALFLALAVPAAADPPPRDFEPSKKPRPEPQAPAPAPAPEKPAPAAPAAPKRPGDRGDFKVVYSAVKDPDYKELQQIFKDTALFEETVKALNETLALPADVTVTLRECGEINAFYEPDSRRISMCYELVGAFTEMFLADAETEEEAEAAGVSVAGATLFIFFHEAGHALIDLYDLPITGKEEDAVDQLATLILLEAGEDGENAALDGASSFLTEEEEEAEGDEEAGLEELAFWDEHSLDEQRFYNIICWIYGKNPEGFAYLVEDETLPEGRAGSCPGEYERMSKAWDTLLEPYVKE